MSAIIRRTRGSMLCAVAQVITVSYLPDAADASEAWYSVNPLISRPPGPWRALSLFPLISYVRNQAGEAPAQRKRARNPATPAPCEPIPANRAELRPVDSPSAFSYQLNLRPVAQSV